MTIVGVVGAGAWGTALAIAARRAGHEVRIWARDGAVAAAINERHENPAYLPGVAIDPEITATSDLAAVAEADMVLLVTPAQHLREVARGFAARAERQVPMVICSKGVEQGTGALMTEVLRAALPEAPTAVLSGPTFAIEVARDLPAAATLASADLELARRLASAIGSRTFRIYHTTDTVGVQIGGAVKNVIAIAAGVVEGRALGDNARAALVTRGLAEIGRLAAALGGGPRTLMGLAGLGDLMLTCSARQSRNFSLGIALGEGRSLAEVMAERHSVAEGVHTARSVVTLAARLGVEMPISAAVDAVLHSNADIGDAIGTLLGRPFTSEG